jgi:hypothetical protein
LWFPVRYIAYYQQHISITALVKGKAMPRLTGGEIVIDRLVTEGVQYLVGIPGHGALGLMDAAKNASDKIDIIQVRHEQSAVHLADGYYRVSDSHLPVSLPLAPVRSTRPLGLAPVLLSPRPPWSSLARRTLTCGAGESFRKSNANHLPTSHPRWSRS